jgi:hypothetical protein
MSLRLRAARTLGAAALLVLAGCDRRQAEIADAPVVVSASIEPATATTGDRVTYRLRVEHDPDLEVVVAEPEAQIGGLQIVNAGAVPPRRLGLLSDRRVDERWWELRADLVGSYELPAFEVGVRSRAPAGQASGEAGAELSIVAAEPVLLEIESILPADGSAEDILDIKPLRGRPEAFRWWWVIAGLVAAVLATAALFYARRRRAVTPAAPAVPAHLVAYQALDALKASELGDAESVRRYYFALSGTLRTYVEGRFGLNATDLTSEEILACLSPSRRPVRRGQAIGMRLELDAEADALLRRFLVETDRVKYADERPGHAAIEATWSRARRFVEVTEPRGEEEAASSEATDGEKAA